MTTQIQKYRPSLTASQIVYIIKLAEKELPRSQEAASILRSLVPFISKIEHGAIEVSYTATPRPDILDTLGAYSLSSLTVSKKAYNKDFLSTPFTFIFNYQY